MKIDASRYQMFWANPERYRLREIWKLAPIEPKAGTFASLLTFGRRRGTCFHELLDGAYRGVPQEQVVQALKDGGFGEKEIEVATRMAGRVREIYPSERYLAHEAEFQYDIPGSSHSLVGRIDHILERDDRVLIGDWKTSKYRSKKDTARLVNDYCRSFQVGFYLLGARALGFEPKRFLYRLVQSERNAPGVEVTEHFTERTGLQLKQLAKDVALTCDLIEDMKLKYGVQAPWPTVPEQFDRGYGAIEGRPMYHGFTPDGYTQKVEHLRCLQEDETEESDAV